MNDRFPFKSRHRLQWQIVLVDPRLLKLVQRRLRASGPSHAIEQSLRLALGETAIAFRESRKAPPVH